MSRELPNLPRMRKPCDLPSVESSNSFWHTEVSPLLKAHRSTRNLPSNADVVIIGSGITGASVAHHLLSGGAAEANSDGPSVIMLEAREACFGATGRNGGHCQPLLFEHPNDPEIGFFELANHQSLEKLIATEEIDCEWVTQPCARGIYTDHKLAHCQLALATLQKTTPELADMMRVVTDKDELVRLRLPTALGAMYTSIAARVWPYKLVAHLLESLLVSTNLNGSFNLQTLTPAESIEPAGDGAWKVNTPRGTITARKLVLATNAYTSHLLPSFKDLIVPCRGQMSALKPSPSLAGSNRLPTSYGFEGDGLDDYLIQRPNETGGHLMFGGGRQNGEPTLGVTDDTIVDPKVATYLRRRLPAIMQTSDRTSGHAELEATHEWTGIMGFSRDEIPWVGPLPEPEQKGIFVSAGYTGHGMPNTWLCGKATACMVEHALAHEAEDDHVTQAVKVAQEHTGLPESYLVTHKRIAQAMQIADVEDREREEMAKCQHVLEQSDS